MPARRRGSTRPLPPVAATHGWAWGTPGPDHRTAGVRAPSGTSDVFRNFVVAVPFEGTRYVRGFQFRPRNRAVHHANIRVDRTTASAQLDAADPSPGYEGVILHSADYPAGHFLGWTPGQAAPPHGNLAWPLTGGSFFVVQLHMRSTGRADTCRPLLGLISPTPRRRHTPTMIRLGRQDLKIRAGDRRFKTVDSFVTPVP